MTCPEKIVYRSLAAAARAALEQLESHGRVQRPYECTVCGDFHLTSQPMHGATLTASMVTALAAALHITR